MINQNIPFKIFANVIPVVGATQSVICDVQRQSYQIIPNTIYEILTTFEGVTLYEIKLNFENQYDEIIEEYFEFLEANDYIFFTKTPQNFPKLALDWDNPAIISNAVIDILSVSNIAWPKLIKQLNELKCKHIQIRNFDTFSMNDFHNLLRFFENTSILSIDLVSKYNEECDESSLLNLIEKYPRIFSITITNAPLFIKTIAKLGCVIFIENEINNSTHCGNIHQSLFHINIPTFTESQHHNTCLNRKISIDVDGNIKNCPSMAQSFGNIKDTRLEEALAHPDLKKYWNIKKDDIAVCRDCEFRHICTDCRAYIENPEDMYSKPLKCGYNPYTAEWEEWSTNPLKQKAIEYYKMIK